MSGNLRKSRERERECYNVQYRNLIVEQRIK